MMPTITIRSKLIELVERGEEILITRRNKVVAKIVPIMTSRKKRRLDLFKGKFAVPHNFSAALPEDELDAWDQ